MAKLPTEDRVGDTILGRYQVVRLIEKGGMGAVYEVTHKNLGRRFAAKMLSPELSRNEDALTRFRREADAIARLRHPNIVDVVDWDLLDDGSPVLVMEYLRGGTLADTIQRGGPMAWEVFADVADRCLSAIQVAHAAGIVHRDLKPANIFLAVDDAGQVHPKVLDFGVSKVADANTMVGTNPTILGTPSYMSPEQAEGRGAEIGPATDVWAMGAVLYEMATGRMAFTADSVPSILYQVCHGRPESMTALRPDASPRLVDVVMRTLTRDPERRIRDASRLRRELRAAMMSMVDSDTFDRVTPFPRRPTPAPVRGRAAAASIDPDAPTRIEAQPPEMEEAPPPRGHRLAVIATVALVAIAGAVGLAFITSNRGEPEERREDPPPRPVAVVAADAAPPAPTAIETPPPAPEQIRLTIRSEPSGAVVLDSTGVRVGTTPFEVSAEKGSGPRSYFLRMRRFRDRRVDWAVDMTETHEIRLRRSDRPAPKEPDGAVDPNATDNPFRGP
jgi:serine/threonine protein kinase